MTTFCTFLHNNSVEEEIVLSLNKYSCLLDSFAFVLQQTPSTLAAEVGHTGINEDGTPRGFHIQELIEVLLNRRHTVTPIELYPVGRIGEQDSVIAFEDNERRFARHLLGRVGVITGHNDRRQPHAVAWRGHEIHDPATGLAESLIGFDGWNRPYLRPISFLPQCFWRID